MSDFEKVIELQPKFEYAYHYRGRVYYELKQYKNALKDFEKVYELNPDYPDNLKNSIEDLKEKLKKD